MTVRDRHDKPADTVECVYCGRDVPAETTVPKVSDDDAWARLAQFHAPDCEWIRTRAHRLD